MRALILAAGVGRRLRAVHDAPKCLLELGGRSLLARQLEALAACGVGEVVICTGYRHERVAAAIPAGAGVELVSNPRYEQGSVLSLWCLREHLGQPGGALVLDADVLFDPRILARLLASEHGNCLLLDRDFEAGEEPVKVLLRDGRIRELRKRVDPGLAFDLCGESIGFYRFDAGAGAALRTILERYERAGRTGEPHEEAIRELVLSQPEAFGYEDVTGLAWTEIDFPEDLRRAREAILPRIEPDTP